MPFETLENIVRVDLSVVRGDSFFKEFWLSECLDNVVIPLSFTGYTPIAEVRRSPTSRVVVTPTVTVTDNTYGELSMEMTTAQTLSLRTGQYVWSMRVEADSQPEENTHTLISGLLVVTDRISDSVTGESCLSCS